MLIGEMFASVILQNHESSEKPNQGDTYSNESLGAMYLAKYLLPGFIYREKNHDR